MARSKRLCDVYGHAGEREIVLRILREQVGRLHEVEVMRKEIEHLHDVQDTTGTIQILTGTSAHSKCWGQKHAHTLGRSRTELQFAPAKMPEPKPPKSTPRIGSRISALKSKEFPVPADRWADLVPRQLAIHRPQHSVMYDVVEILVFGSRCARMKNAMLG